MPKSRGKSISITINIRESDRDIAAWFNLLKESGQSKSMWVGALLVAYKKGILLDTGCIGVLPEITNDSNEPPPPPPPSPRSSSSFLFGSGDAQSSKAPPAKPTYSWSMRGEHGEYVVGSAVTVRVSNQKAKDIYRSYRYQGLCVSDIIRATIRRGLHRGTEPEAPDPEPALEILRETKKNPYDKRLRPYEEVREARRENEK